jgi:hypothetical protein
MHLRPATLDGQDQRLGRGLPLLEVLLDFRQLHDVVGAVLQRVKLPAAGQVDRAVLVKDHPGDVRLTKEAFRRQKVFVSEQYCSVNAGWVGYGGSIIARHRQPSVTESSVTLPPQYREAPCPRPNNS